MDDDARLGSDERLTLRPPMALRRALLAAYPIEKFPTLESETAVWERAAEDAIRDETDVTVVVLDAESATEMINDLVDSD